MKLLVQKHDFWFCRGKEDDEDVVRKIRRGRHDETKDDSQDDRLEGGDVGISPHWSFPYERDEHGNKSVQTKWLKDTFELVCVDNRKPSCGDEEQEDERCVRGNEPPWGGGVGHEEASDFLLSLRRMDSIIRSLGESCARLSSRAIFAASSNAVS